MTKNLRLTVFMILMAMLTTSCALIPGWGHHGHSGHYGHRSHGNYGHDQHKRHDNESRKHGDHRKQGRSSH